MKIKVGEKLPSSKLFYLDQNNNVKIQDLARSQLPLTSCANQIL